MPEVARRRRLSAADAALGGFYLVAVAGWIGTQRWPGAALLALPALAGSLLEVDAVSDRLRRRGERDSWLLVGLATVLGVGWTIYAVVDEQLLAVLRGVIGSGLVMMGGFFAAGRRVWHPGRGLVPVGLALLVLAGLDPQASTLANAVAALALLAWLALERPTLRRPGAPLRRGAGLLPFLGLAAVLSAAIAVALPLAQPAVERAAAQVLSGSDRALSGLSDTSALGEVEQLALSREVVLRLRAEQPLRLRARVYTHFDGRRWSTAPGTPVAMRPVALAPAGLAQRAEALPGRSFSYPGQLGPDAPAWAELLIARLEPGRLVTPRGAQLVRIAGGTPLIDPAGALTAPFWPPARLYGVGHARRALTPLTAEQRGAALQLPEPLDPRLAALAAELAAGAGSDRERVASTLGWIGRECRYALDVGGFESDQPLAEFLFEKKRGYCEYFASAAALLLRLQGVPARYAAGFNVRDENRRGDHYLVRASDAHAWIEAWVDGEGWVESDPTPGAQYDALRAGQRDGAMAQAWEALAAFAAELSARFGQDWREALAWLATRAGALGRWLGERAASLLGLALLGAALVWAWRRRPRRAESPARAALAEAGVDPALAALLRSLDRRWVALGHARPPHRAPLEHLQALPPDALAPGLRSASHALVDCYYRARFAGQSPDPSLLVRLRRDLDAA